MGLQAKVDGIWAIASLRLGATKRRQIEPLLATLSKTATGGDFQVRGRKAEADRARTSQVIAAEIMVAFWVASADALGPKGTLFFLWRRPGTKLVVIALVAVLLGAALRDRWSEIGAMFGPPK
jgi:hypothetical protein